jgi:hypothetical protein
LPSGKKHFSLNGGVGQPFCIFSEERNVHHRSKESNKMQVNHKLYQSIKEEENYEK